MATATEIVELLRGQISDGTLRKGDRLPSTRQITARWGVAMATASKVLATLRDEGLVRTVPGVGTQVVGAETRRLSPRGRTDRREHALSVARIVAAGMAIADAEGLAALSMRRVALDLDVATMSLYRHVRDKDDLVNRMLESAFAEWRPPARMPTGFRAVLELAATALWRTYRTHPWLASGLSLSRPAPVSAGFVHSEIVLAALTRRGFDATTAFSLHLVLFNFVRGFAVGLESEVLAEADTGVTADEWADLQRADFDQAMSGLALPAMTAVLSSFGDDGYDFDLDALFSTGLGVLLDGLERAR